MHDTYAYWSAFGQCVILALIQIGGLGLVTLTTFFNIAIGRKLGLRGMHLAQESVASTGPDINQLMKVVMITALTVETAGALLLATVFVPEFGAEGIFISVFTSVSAFCNAGFDIFGRAEPYVSLTGYVGNPIVVGTVGLLIIVGGIGFIVIHDLLQYRRTKKLLLHTRIVIVSTVSLILVGMAFTAVCEWNNPFTLGGLSGTGERLGAAWFHSVSCRTAGFNVFPLEPMHDITKILSSLLMFVGAAPARRAAASSARPSRSSL